MTAPTSNAPPAGFAELGLDAAVLAAVRDVGYEAPSAIQAAAIPPLLAGKDLLGQAQTGTGKTAAFALPLLSRLDLKREKPQVLVLTPTRELAIQVAEAMQTYARHLKHFHVLPIYGGQGMVFQLRNLRRGVHIVVGTPGRIQDHLRRKTLKLDGLRTVVIDEADEMLRMGFIEEVEEILDATPDEKQVALFTATMPERVRIIAQRYLREPVEIKIKAKTATVASVDQRYVEIRGFDKLEALTRIIETENFDAMLIFVRTRTATTELAEKLSARGLACAPLSGEMTQALRERTVTQLKNGKLDIVVATDVAARGLDIERVTHVVNYDIPHDVEGYIHRIGRTGRAGRTGHAILLVVPRERRLLSAIERATRQPVTPMRLPTPADVVDRRAAVFKQTITDALDTQGLGFFADLVTSYAAEHGKDLRDVAAALAYLAQKDRPLQPPLERSEPREPLELRKPREPRAPRAPRAPREDRDAGARPSKRRGVAGPVDNWVRYRIEVGRDHGVQPGNIVGAIANEAGIDAVHIGRIEIFDAYSIVDLPEGMPSDTYKVLHKARVCGQKLALRAIEDGVHSAPASRKPPRHDSRKPPRHDSSKPPRHDSSKPPHAASKAPRSSSKPPRSDKAPRSGKPPRTRKSPRDTGGTLPPAASPTKRRG